MLARVAFSVLLALVAACEGTFIFISSDGVLFVHVSTGGFGRDPNGFTLIVDGRMTSSVAPDGSARLQGLSPGSHSVLLSDVAANCRVEGENPQQIVVESDGQANLEFSVSCSPSGG